jgi:hypothetical protein
MSHLGKNRLVIHNTVLGSAQAQQQLVGISVAIARTSVPAFQFSVLTCKRGVLATKTIYADGKEAPYDRAKNFLFKYCEIETLEEFAEALDWLANQQHRFIIRGQLKSGLNSCVSHRRLLLSRDGDPATIECPPRRWIVLDIDGVRVPVGLGASEKLAEAGYHIRDNLLPPMFRGIRCVASATSSTGRVGLPSARLRLFFILTEAVDNDLLYAWIEHLNKHGCAFLDPSVMQAQQPIYTARPVFVRCDDPIPKWGRVRVLDGYEDTIAPELPRARRPKKEFAPLLKVVGGDMPEWMVPLAVRDAGCGVHPIDTTDKAWSAIRRIFEMLDGCGVEPKVGDRGRHKTLYKAGWELACLVAEGELTEAVARDAYWKAADGIINSDGKYDTAAIQQQLDNAFTNVSTGRRE